ncbi:Uncharacterised protein [BD1-7 clade bacterium]|uniref:Uncharacterized protein n=1 Tax=BD1-7 clade bacterium TaxID=2029982 RepID=A0A5S9QIN0_9GAMM|nr:Uncharacterised protein [BD1-7 clade bacterium]CAA0117596.1 Uncharacterised protein [BD1-7 clade bacterium]
MAWLADTPLFNAFVIDNDGNEIPITRAMIEKSCAALEETTEPSASKTGPEINHSRWSETH